MVRSCKWILAAVVLLLSATPSAGMNDHYSRAGRCEYPTALHIGLIGVESRKLAVLCSGVYVGHGLMLTAGHCADNIDEDAEAYVYFGEDWQDPAWYTKSVECVANPDGRQSSVNKKLYLGPDIAFCKLGSGSDSGWPEPPIVPVLVPNSCENDYISHVMFDSPPPLSAFPNEPFGSSINKVFGTAVGMGLNDPACETPLDPGCSTGIKRFARLPFRGESYRTSTLSILFPAIEPDPVVIMGGDSGGPLFFRMADGSWRLIGLATRTTPNKLPVFDPVTGRVEERHFNVTLYTAVPRYLSWIERTSGVDITPCHDFNNVSKRWDFTGGPSCADNVPTSERAGGGSWEFGIGPHSVTACGGSLVSMADECAGWTPPPPSPPGPPPIGFPPLPTSEGEAILALAISGEAGLSEPFPPRPGFGFFGPTSTKLELFGTTGSDRIEGSDEAETVAAGPGSDFVRSRGGDDVLMGSSGNDHLWGGDGDDLIIPGRGRDHVKGGSGDDIVVISGACELEPGEVLLGGPGADTLVSPLSVKQMRRRGVNVQQFETVLSTHPDSERSVCDFPSADSQHPRRGRRRGPRGNR